MIAMYQKSHWQKQVVSEALVRTLWCYAWKRTEQHDHEGHFIPSARTSNITCVN